MRTTVTLESDTRMLIERAMRERGLTFKQAINQAIRAGLGSTASPRRTYTEPRHLGSASVDITKALSLAGALEDEAVAARLSERR